MTINKDSIELTLYDKQWPEKAALEIKKLYQLFSVHHIIDIQHVGSTAIPGMCAKPIIDIQIAVNSLDAIKQDAIKILESNGYNYWDKNPDSTRMFFAKGMPPFGEKRTHHVHIVEFDSKHWREKIRFRDYLIAHPEVAHEYETLKITLAEKYTDDREKYTEAKTDFIHKILHIIIETERLILRRWKDSDIDAYYHINQDPRVIEFLRGSLSMQEIQDFMKAQNQQLDQTGYALWAAEEKSSGKLLGFIGLNQLETGFPFSPCVEIGWRLGSDYWNKGYATEGARAVLEYGFKHTKLKEIVAFTAQDNIRSICVMEKIGMVKDAKGDFAHPKLPKDHRLSKHILYRITSSSLK